MNDSDLLKQKLEDSIAEIKVEVDQLAIANEKNELLNRIKIKLDNILQLPSLLEKSYLDQTENTRCRNLVNTVEDGSWEIDSEGVLTYVNKQLCLMLGFDKGELLGKKAFSLMLNSEAERVSNSFLETLKDQRYFRGFEASLKHKDGYLIYVEISAMPVFHENNFTGYFGVIRDISKRKKTENQLRNQLSFQQMLLEVIPIPIFYKNIEGKYLGCNSAFEKITGLSRNELINKTVFDIAPEDIAGKYEQMDRNLFENQLKQQYSSYVSNKNGTIRDVIFDKALFYDSDGEIAGLIGAITDITEQRKDKDEIQKSANRFQTIIDTVAEGITLSDETGHFEIFNSKMEELCGYSKLEANSSPDFMKLLYPESEQYNNAMHGIEEIRSKGGFRDVETMIKTKTGEIKILLVSTALVNYHDEELFLSAYRDITERILDKEALQNSEELFRTIVETAPSLLLITTENGNIEYISPNCHEILGYTQSEMKENFIWWVHDEDSSKVKKLFTDSLKNKVGVKNIEYKGKKKDGSIWYASSSWKPVINIHNEFKGLIMQTTDITDLKKEQSARIDAEKFAERTMRLASLGTLAGGIAHEINQPLTVLKTEIDGLIMWSNMDNDITHNDIIETLKIITKESGRISEIITNMKYLIRDHKDHRTTKIDINKVINHSINLLKNQIQEHNVTIDREFSDGLTEIEFNRMSLEQIIINMILNSLQAFEDYNRNHKIITIKTSIFDENVIIEVIDNGPGIKDDMIKKIFDPFFTTKLKIKSMGLGLSIVENLITSRAGKIIAENLENGGCIFRISFPINLPLTDKF